LFAASGTTAVVLSNKGSGLNAAVTSPATGEVVRQRDPDTGAGSQWIPTAAEVTYAGWRAASGASANPIDDDDRDLLANLLEYALLSDPIMPGSMPATILPSLRPDGAATAEYAAIVVRRQSTAADLELRVEYSSDLSNWQQSAILTSSTIHGDGTTTETWRAPTTCADGPAGFFRLRVTLTD
jgi:hypothetical protein